MALICVTEVLLKPVTGLIGYIYYRLCGNTSRPLTFLFAPDRVVCFAELDCTSLPTFDTLMYDIFISDGVFFLEKFVYVRVFLYLCIMKNKIIDMKKFLFTAFLATVAMIANADPQSVHKFSLTPHVGFGYAHLSNLDKCSNGGSIVIGAESQYLFNPSLGMSAGIDLGYVQSNKDSYSEVGEIYLTSYSINVPILAQVHLGDHFAVKAGVQPGFLIEPKLHGKIPGYAADEQIKDLTNNFQFSIPVGVSYEFNNPLVLDLRANIPVTRILDKGKLTTDNVSLFNVMLTVGYRFDIDD